MGFYVFLPCVQLSDTERSDSSSAICGSRLHLLLQKVLEGNEFNIPYICIPYINLYLKQLTTMICLLNVSGSSVQIKQMQKKLNLLRLQCAITAPYLPDVLQRLPVHDTVEFGGRRFCPGAAWS